MTQPVDDRAEVLRKMREQVELATQDIDALLVELADQRAAVEDMESLVDAVLGLVSAVMVIVDDEGKVRALSRGAADALGGTDIIGKSSSAALPPDVVAMVKAGSDPDTEENAVGQHDATTIVRRLPNGSMVIVVPDR